MAQALKEVLKPTGGIAVFRTDGFFGCEGGPIKDYFGESDNPFSKAASDAAPYLFCNLDSTPKCQLRSRDQDSAELRKGYERRKAEFIEENERLKKLEGKRE